MKSKLSDGVCGAVVWSVDGRGDGSEPVAHSVVSAEHGNEHFPPAGSLSACSGMSEEHLDGCADGTDWLCVMVLENLCWEEKDLSSSFLEERFAER